METSKLRKFASFARLALIEQVGNRLKTVRAEKSLARRESPKVVEELEKKIKELGQKRLIETVAYTWFNRFCALRYMDVNRYTRIGVLSPADGQFQPEILAEAKMGHIDDELVPEATRKQVMRLLDGSDKSADPQGEAYRLLLVAVCNYYYSLMPFMFEKIADYTELLLPDDLLSGTSIPAYTREALLPINCSPEHTEESVEVIGWLYQFYIADKKDEVFEGLKKGKKITAENIPAATQLFTPHWIVRYLLENSLGRLWMLNHPDSKLIERMDFFIQPEQPEADFIAIASPEEIKVCDPACGSGHMLTYAFDLLYEIYREQQYPEPEIPALILKNNLYGIEIDQRAGALAAFALTMKAREKDKRFFTRKAQPEPLARDLSSIENPKSRIQNPNICVLENIQIDPEDLSAYMDKVGRDLFSGGLQGVVTQWEEADNFGSLIRPRVEDVSEVLELLRAAAVAEDLFLAGVHQKVLKALRQADYLSPKYHVVVANPPYMGSKGMNASLKEFVRVGFPNGKSDMGTAFIERNFSLAAPKGFISMITMQSWMFLSSYENIRLKMLTESTISTLAHLGERAFDTIGGAVVSTVAFVLERTVIANYKGSYIRLTEGENESEKQAAFSDPSNRYAATASDFNAIPGAPLTYWLSDRIRQIFRKCSSLEVFAKPVQGATTSDNGRFLRLWHEVPFDRIGFGFNSLDSAAESGCKWFPYNKGGSFRRWSGNQEFVINYENDGKEIKDFHEELNKTKPGGRLKNQDRYFHPCLSWSKISTGNFAIRFFPEGFIFDVAGSAVFPDSKADTEAFNALLNSSFVTCVLKALSPTLNFEAEHVSKIPVLDRLSERLAEAIPRVRSLVSKSDLDWHSQETAWGFQQSQYMLARNSSDKLVEATERLFTSYSERVREFVFSETEINVLVADAYEVSDEIESEVEAKSVSLLCNPSFRYDNNEENVELEALLLADTMREFISYAVGCMLGRYSLDKPGLILANLGETVDEYRQQIPEPTFAPDEDNVIPILDGDWFDDEISQRFKEFLKVTFGTEHYDENLEFLENALYPDNPSAKKRKTIRDYFLKEFYDHHLKLYKKRPIYWLFSSPKGTFNALIYMHRYRPETVGKVLECLRDFREKLAHHAEQRQGIADSASESKAEKTKAVKDVAAIKKQLKELEDYEKTLFEVAAKKIPIDLDQGVKHNYLLFGPILRRIPGLAAKGD